MEKKVVKRERKFVALYGKRDEGSVWSLEATAA